MIQNIVNVFAILGGLLSVYHLIKLGHQIFVASRVLSWEYVEKSSEKLFSAIANKKYEVDIIVGIGRGGTIVAGMVAAHFRESSQYDRRLIPVGSIDRFYILENGLRKDVIISGFHTIEVHDKKVLLINADSYSGATLKRAKEILSWDRPKEINTATLFSFTGKVSKPFYEADFCGEKLPVGKSSKCLPWRTAKYPFETENDLEFIDRTLIVLHGLVATGKTSVAEAVVKHLGFAPLYSDWYWYKYGFRNREHNRDISREHNKSMLGRCWSAIASGSNVVLDCTSRWRNFRDKIHESFSPRGIVVVFVHCFCSEDSACERIRQRKFIGPHDFGNLFEYERVKNDYEPLDRVELENFNILEVNTDQLECVTKRAKSDQAHAIMEEIAEGIQKYYFSKVREARGSTRSTNAPLDSAIT